MAKSQNLSEAVRKFLNTSLHSEQAIMLCQCAHDSPTFGKRWVQKELPREMNKFTYNDVFTFLKAYALNRKKALAREIDNMELRLQRKDLENEVGQGFGELHDDLLRQAQQIKNFLSFAEALEIFATNPPELEAQRVQWERERDSLRGDIETHIPLEEIEIILGKGNLLASIIQQMSRDFRPVAKMAHDLERGRGQGGRGG